jgi:hypothetical protein
VIGQQVPEPPDELTTSLRHKVSRAQSDWRAPSVVARVVRRGIVQLDAAAGAAALVLQARDDGLLDLDGEVGAHLDVPAHGGATLRRMLCHLSGLQREPVGEVWETP